LSLKVVDKIDVILPAGGRLDDHFARVALTENKALIKVQDYMVGMKSVFAAKESSKVGRIILVGPQPVKDALGGMVDAVVNDTGDLTRNIKMAMMELKNMGNISRRVLILTTDLPYVEAKHIDAFLDLCPETAEISAPIISDEEYLDRFPSSDSTWAKLRDGNWTIGGAYLVNSEAFMRIIPQVEQVVANRKNVFKLAKLLGGGFAWKVLTKSITVPEVVEKVESVIGCKISAVKKAPAELAFDIDDIKDYEYALRNR
jgi:hypothetical protein